MGDLGGPRSNFKSLESAIACSNDPQEAPHMQLIMYDRMGCDKRIMLTCQPFSDESGCVSCCVVELSHSHAMTMSEACSGTQPRALLCTDYPYLTRMVNAGFAAAFGLREDQAMNQPISRSTPLPRCSGLPLVIATGTARFWRNFVAIPVKQFHLSSSNFTSKQDT